MMYGSDDVRGAYHTLNTDVQLELEKLVEGIATLKGLIELTSVINHQYLTELQIVIRIPDQIKQDVPTPNITFNNV